MSRPSLCHAYLWRCWVESAPSCWNSVSVFSQIWVQRNVRKFYLRSVRGSWKKFSTSSSPRHTLSPPPTPLLPPLQSQHADLAAASTAAVKTNFIWILFTPCSRSGTFYYTKRYMNTKKSSARVKLGNLWSHKVRIRLTRYGFPWRILDSTPRTVLPERVCWKRRSYWVSLRQEQSTSPAQQLSELYSYIPKLCGTYPGFCDTSNCTAGCI